MLTEATLEDFETFDNSGPGGASGTAKPLTLTYPQVVALGGNYTFTAVLANEVSNITLVTDVSQLIVFKYSTYLTLFDFSRCH